MDPREFRTTLGHFPTGVAVVTTHDADFGPRRDVVRVLGLGRRHPNELSVVDGCEVNGRRPGSAGGPRVAVGPPANGIVEVAGPQEFRLDEFIREGLQAYNDPRSVVADPRAGYFEFQRHG